MFVSFNDGKAKLATTDARTVNIPKSRLSEHDIHVLDYLTAEKNDPNAKLIIGTPVEVLDGDTLHVDDLFGQRFTIRLQGIDAPENDQAYGLDSRQELRRFLLNKIIQVEWNETDRYQRILGFVYANGVQVNRHLIREGLAWHYEKYSSDESFAKAEDYAKSKEQGLWKEPVRIAPWDWRNGVRTATVKPVEAPSIRTTDTTVYVTRTGSKYHRSGCQYLRKSKIPIPLSRARSAYSACSRCNPPN